MKMKLVMVGTALTGLLVALSHLTFGNPEPLPPVPASVAVGATAAPTVALPEPSLPALLTIAQAASMQDGSMEETESADMDSLADVESMEAEVESLEAEAGSMEEASTMGEEFELDPQPDLVGVEAEGEDLITISLDNAPLADVVRMFSRISGANIVAGTNLQGSVTVSMHDVPWEPALSAILDSVNLVLVEKTSGIYTIISKSDLASEPVSMETIFLNYTSVSNVLPVVEKMLIATNGTASAFPSANAIVVQETASRLSAIRSTVKKIDQPRPQVYIEAKFIELNDSAIENLGVNWQVLQGYTLGVTPGLEYADERVTTDTYTDRLETGTARNRQTRQTFSSVAGDERNDVRYNADGVINTSDGNFDVSLTGRNAIPTVTREVDPNTGQTTVTTELSDVVPVRGVTSNRAEERITETVDTAVDSFNRVQDSVTQDTVGRLLSAVLSADELAVTLSALKEQDGVEVVSNPKVIVSNGETAKIHVGRNEPNVTAVPQGDTGDRFAVSLDQNQPYIEIGVKLEVTPTVNTEDNITVKIVPELSRKLGDLQVGAVGVSYPITSVRRIETEFQLASGRTVAIGGLTETSDEESIRKVPVLGDIPVIGKYLFQHKSTSRVQDEVVIFVTVGLANPKNLVEISGIPSEGQLIHRHLANRASEELGGTMD